MSRMLLMGDVKQVIRCWDGSWTQTGIMTAEDVVEYILEHGGLKTVEYQDQEGNFLLSFNTMES